MDMKDRLKNRRVRHSTSHVPVGRTGHRKIWQEHLSKASTSEAEIKRWSCGFGHEFYPSCAFVSPVKLHYCLKLDKKPGLHSGWPISRATVAVMELIRQLLDAEGRRNMRYVKSWKNKEDLETKRKSWCGQKKRETQSSASILMTRDKEIQTRKYQLVLSHSTVLTLVLVLIVNVSGTYKRIQNIWQNPDIALSSFHYRSKKQ